MGDENFESMFQDLTGHAPLSWQQRLYKEWIDSDRKIKPVIDLPTGLGKTMVMAIWLIARTENPELGRRLIYVVDRRTVVDQATDIAQRLVARPITKWMHENFRGGPPSISTLRGQFADNREWTRDPSKPAIIIGTVDMIGSRLLFSGYNLSPSLRPIHAGLLGQDSLVVLDEAHLSPAFDCLLSQIHHAQTGRAIALQRSPRCEPRPMRIITMSATLGRNSDAFTLTKEDETDSIVQKRISSVKRLHLHHADDVRTEIISRALLMADRTERVIIYVRSPDEAKKIGAQLRKTYSESVEVLTGTMRGYERDKQLSCPVFRRFFKPDDPEPNTKPTFIVATAAGEVGVDFNADHLICDLTPIDSLIQRLGRVNRRGLSPAEVHLVVLSAPKISTDYDKRCAATLALIESITTQQDGTRDVSPRALRDLNITDAERSPKPPILPLTDILIDAWSMTSIRNALPGRPMIEPWLRGDDENEIPQTIVTWRIELDHITDFDVLQEAMESYPLKPHELLREKTEVIVKALAAMPEELWTNCALINGTDSKSYHLDELAKRARMGRDRLIAELKDKTLVLPVSIGGIDQAGMFSDWGQIDLPPRVDVADIDEESRSKRKRIWCGLEEPEDELAPPPDLIINSEDEIPQLGDGMRFINAVRIQFNTDGEPTQWLAYFAAEIEGNRNWSRRKQSLNDHVNDVVNCAKAIVGELQLSADLAGAIEMAARYHDTGKARELWQTYARRTQADEILGKSNKYLHWQTLGQTREDCFRHEFASLCDVAENEEIKKHPQKDLILHLIASHHARGRPHFDNTFDPEAPANVNPDAIATEVPVRFAKLQRTFGRWGLAWLESILRCADQRASAKHDERKVEGNK
jgi:CRISPR-associated endonuclease/helicase Cas3